MSYIGRQISNLSDRVKLDAITASATATYNLLLNGVAYVPSSAESLTVVLNGINQSPNSSYTVSGSTITFASTLSASDSIDFILAERSITLQTPSSGSVNTEQLANSSVTLDKLSATGTKDATTFLRGDNTFASAGADADNYFATSGLSSKDLGVGLHVKTADSGGSVDGNADELVVEGSGQSGITILSGASDKGNIFFADSASTAQGKIIYDHSSDVLRFDSAGSERMNIVETGVQIGNLNENLNFNSSSHGLAVSGNGYASLRVRRGADNGEAVAFFGSANNTTPVGNISVTTSSVAYNTSSDYRLKENEVTISDGIERLKQLKPYKFNFKTDADTTLDGFFAHEVSSVVPEAISGEKDATETYTDENGNEQTIIKPQAIDQSKLVPLLTSALQEAITKIETLEAKVESLENA